VKNAHRSLFEEITFTGHIVYFHANGSIHDRTVCGLNLKKDIPEHSVDWIWLHPEKYMNVLRLSKLAFAGNNLLGDEFPGGPFNLGGLHSMLALSALHISI
jgi:hypothetical protein